MNTAATPDSFRSIAMLIDGQWRTDGGDGVITVTNPATGEPLCDVPAAGDAQIDEALAAAQRGFRVWRDTPPAARCAVILRAAALLRERSEKLSMVMTLEQGKPIAESRAEALRAAELIEWAAEEGRRTYGLTIPAPPGHRYLTFAEPLGPVAALTPWNFPAVSPARKIGSSLAAGCSCILKPSELTPVTAFEMARAFQDAGLPPGVLGVLYGDPARVSTRLIESPVIRKVTFTGSVPVGRRLSEQAARRVLPCLMELGGHSPTIVFPDADLGRVAAAAVTAKFRNAGQVCTSPTRFYVHKDVYTDFVRALADGARALRLGDGREPGTQMGPVASQRRADALAALVDDARAAGAAVAAGGAPLAGAGSFFAPTVLDDVPTQARMMREEPFGPVAACRPFSTIDEVLEQANALPYGLAAYLFTGSIHTARRVAHGLECGIVGVNSFSGSNPETPFGGVKDSGHGREGGTEGVRAYMSTKFIVEGPL